MSQLGGADDLATGRENLILQGRLYGGDLASVTRRTEEVMDILDLSEFADRRVKTYSGGQRRRLDIALGIVHQPEVLFLDEPSTGLDPQNRANLWDHVRALRDQGATIFLTTHYLEEADALCDRLVIMDHGEIVVEGTPRGPEAPGGRRVGGAQPPRRGRRHGIGPRRCSAPRPSSGRSAPTVTRSASTWRTASAALPQILRLLDAERIGIKSMSVSEPTLDDVFLRQTGRSLRDAGATGREERTA